MLSSERLERRPYDSIASIMANWNTQRTEQALEDIVFSVVNGTKSALEKPREEIMKLARCKHPGAPHLHIGSLARHAIDDLVAPDDQGHLEIAFVEEPGIPMLQVRTSTFSDSVDQDSVIVWIAINMSDSKTHLWQHNRLPDDILLPAIRAFADAAVTLTQELHAHPTHVLYRSQFPAMM